MVKINRRFRNSQKLKGIPPLSVVGKTELETSSQNSWKKTLLVGIGLIMGLLFFFFLFTSSGKNILSLLNGLLFQKDIQLQTAHARTINLLILGIGGGTHSGPNLTDTIVFAHLDPDKNTIQLIAVPRDLWIPQLQAKINSAYAYGLKKENKGILLADVTVEKVLGQPIDYTIVGDFQGFIKLIDLLGGVDVDVQRSFTDTFYPIPGKGGDPCDKTPEDIPFLVATASSEFEVFPCRYQEINFDKGLQEMNGERALLFVRSRHAIGEEGTDFARSKRQNQIILAVKNKVLSIGTLTNPVKVLGMYNVVKDHITTDVNPEEFDDFIKLAQKMQHATISHHVIEAGDDEKGTFGLVENPPISDEYKLQWVLAPRAGNGKFSEIHEYVKCIINGKACEVTKSDIRQPNSSSAK